MRMRGRRGQRALAGIAVAALAMSLAACGGDDDEGGEDEGGGASGDPLIFGASADPVILDGPFASDGETIRVLRQIYEGLVTTEQGGTEVVPALATEWEASEDGTEWTFTLRDDVTFHNGDEFNAEAVCFNFDRWYNFTGIAQSPAVTYYWTTVFGGFANNEDPEAPPSLYSSCEAVDATHAKITLSTPSASFLSALTLPAFSMGSPRAIEEGNANEIGGTGESPDFSASTYGNEAPVGTGPYQLQSWVKGDRLTVEAYADHWGDGAQIDEVVFVPIADGPARRQALEAGDIDMYDQVDPADTQALADAGFQILEREAFNVGYLGFNQATPLLQDVRIRQAIAHAINKEALLTTAYPEGAEAAINFMPPSLFGWTDDVEVYDYDPDAAKALLAAGRPAEPDRRVLVPVGGHPAIHAEPAAELRADEGRPRGGRVHGRADDGAVEPGLPEHRAERRSPDVPARVDRRLRRPGQLRGHVLPEHRPAVGL